MSEKQSKKTETPPTVITLTLPTPEGGGIALERATATLLIQRGELAHIHQFHYQGALSDLMNAIREAEAGLGQVEDNPPIIPDLPEEKPEPKKKAKAAQKPQQQADEEPTIDIPLKKGVKAVKMSYLKIVGGETDAAAYRQAVLIAGKLIAGGLWDGESPIRINDVYATTKKMQHLTDKDFSLFNMEDFVQTGAITEEAVPTDDVKDPVPAITASLNGHHPDDQHPDEPSTLL
jgi:hypothetical protein